MTDPDLPILDDAARALSQAYTKMDESPWRRLRGRRVFLGLLAAAVLAPGAVATKSALDGHDSSPAQSPAGRVLLAGGTAASPWRLEAVRGSRQQCLLLITGVATNSPCLAPEPPPGGLQVRRAKGQRASYVYGTASADVARVSALGVSGSAHRLLISGRALTVYVIELPREAFGRGSVTAYSSAGDRVATVR